jgi:O-antigen ligase
MWRDNPVLGVGQGQFTEYHYLTAHNSFLLTLAEMGPLGLFVYSCILYFALKITLRAQLDLDRPEAAVARSWGASIMASLAALTVSSFFLSVPFNTILWIFLAMAGSFYAAVRRHEPSWRVRFGLGDLALVAFTDVTMVLGLMFYIRLKGV